MILGFSKPEFVPKIQECLNNKTHQFVGKIHTMREDPTLRWQQGNIINFATGVRTSNYKEFATGTCTAIETAIMTIDSQTNEFKVRVGYNELSAAELKIMASFDGFDQVEDFIDWFTPIVKKKGGEYRPRIIHWTNFRWEDYLCFDSILEGPRSAELTYRCFGMYYGYRQCCIDNYITMKRDSISYLTTNQVNIQEHLAKPEFFPCAKCADEFVAKAGVHGWPINYDARICTTPFIMHPGNNSTEADAFYQLYCKFKGVLPSKEFIRAVFEYHKASGVIPPFELLTTINNPAPFIWASLECYTEKRWQNNQHHKIITTHF